MTPRALGILACLAGAGALQCAGLAHGEESAAHLGRNMAELSFAPVPGLPTCAPGFVESGDPATGPSIILANLAEGCTIPWHWHTANEHLMLVTGAARLETPDGSPLTLGAGGFARLPARHVHRFSCSTPCALFVYSDAPFDIHYVDARGQDLAPDAALGAERESPAKPAR